MQSDPAPKAKNPVRRWLRGIALSPLLALLLFEEWGWDPLARRLTALAKLPIWAAVEQRVKDLPPWAALLVFALPVLALVPVKLLALYLLGNGHLILGFLLVISAKLVGTAIAARLFQLTEPALMRMGWFARLYTPWKIWKNALLEQVRHSALWLQVRQLKARGKAAASRSWLALKARF